jgi:hypothetical protein
MEITPPPNSTNSNLCCYFKDVLIQHLTLVCLLGCHFFPFVAPGEWRLCHRIKVVPGNDKPVWEINKLVNMMRCQIHITMKIKPKKNVLLHERLLLSSFVFSIEFIKFLHRHGHRSRCLLRDELQLEKYAW